MGIEVDFHSSPEARQFTSESISNSPNLADHNIAPSFSVICIGVMLIWCLQMLLLIEIDVSEII